MGYLICQDCGGYYKLENGESKEDFVSCECHGSLIYVENIDEYLNGNNDFNKDYISNKDYKSNKDFPKTVENKLTNVEESINETPLDNHLADSDYNSESGFRGEIPQKKEISRSLGFSSFSKNTPKFKSGSRTNNVSNSDVSKKDLSKTVVYNKSTSKRGPVNQINETEDVDVMGFFS